LLSGDVDKVFVHAAVHDRVDQRGGLGQLQRDALLRVTAISDPRISYEVRVAVRVAVWVAYGWRGWPCGG
tara:strand:- start:305 stop:514 length:210 start_codon:yes stop_codon:yes gene_type:complete